MNRKIKTICITIAFIFFLNINAIKVFGKEKYINMKQLENGIYQHLIKGDTYISFVYTGSKEEFEENISKTIQNAYKRDSYIERSWSEIVPEAVAKRDYIEGNISISYSTTQNEEEYVNEEIQKISSNIKQELSDFEKIKFINNYLMKRFDYDYKLESTNAYTALKTNCAVCQGYSMTAYKLLESVNVESKIIVGTSDENPHSWNLVKINGKWYHLDITNNDTTQSDKYFLKNDEFMKINGYDWNSEDYPAAY